MSVAEAQAKIDSREFAEWVAYDRLDPFGESRADLRSAIVATVSANANRGRGRRAFEVTDFMPSFDRRAQTKSPEEMQSVLFTFAEAHNAAIGAAR